jgi:ATP-dependent helicase HepA
MNNLVQLGAVELAHFLSASLPPLSDTWWQQHVVDRLSFQQQRMIQERGCNTLVQLDFAALLRVLDQNWYELSARLLLPREGRNWVKELQNARNRWAHLSAQGTPASEVHRDADTLGRFLAMIGASATTLAAVEQTKSLALRQMTTKDLADADHAAPAALASTTPSKESATETAAASTTATPGPSFNCGDLVALRSNPAQVMSVLDVIQVAGENRYRVFHNNAKSEYYESQLQALVEADDERATLVADELRAYLTSLQLLSPSTANLFSLRSGRVNFVPYQYRPVLKLIRADQPRFSSPMKLASARPSRPG